MILDCLPDEFQAYAEVSVNKPVAHTDDFTPVCFLMGIHKIVREFRSCLPDNLEIT